MVKIMKLFCTAVLILFCSKTCQDVVICSNLGLNVLNSMCNTGFRNQMAAAKAAAETGPAGCRSSTNSLSRDKKIRMCVDFGVHRCDLC